MIARRVAALVAVAAVLPLAACSSTPTYEPDTACSMAADDVATALDTDRFTADGADFPALPDPSSTSERTFFCAAEGGDRRVVVELNVVGIEEAERQIAIIADNADSYELLGGRAGNNASGASWACGSIVVQLDVRGDDVSVDLDTMKSAITSLAEGIGCYDEPLT